MFLYMSDDILVTGSDSAVVQQVIQSFAKRFSIKDLVDLHYFLGIEANRTPQGLHLMQRKYVNDIISKHNMGDAKLVSTTLPTSPKLTLAGGNLLADAAPYRSLIGSLQYLAFTRRDLSYAVTRLSHFMHQPKFSECSLYFGGLLQCRAAMAKKTNNWTVKKNYKSMASFIINK